MSDDTTRALLEVFQTEAADALDELGQLASELDTAEGSSLRSSAKAALRLAHNIKGAAGSVGLEEISALAHTLEEALSPCCVADSCPPVELSRLIQTAVNTIERLAEGRRVDLRPQRFPQALERGDLFIELRQPCRDRHLGGVRQQLGQLPRPGFVRSRPRRVNSHILRGGTRLIRAPPEECSE